jgi:TP901 family phage tail tape measure protein
MAFTPTGVQFVARGLSSYLSNLSSANQAQQNLGFSAEGVGAAFASLGTGVLNFGATAAKVAAGGVAALGAALTTFAVTGIEKSIDLDQQLANIAATMGTTKDEIGPLKDLISELALSDKLVVDTTQAAEAIELLARNGLEMSEILGGAAEATVQLANATDAEFGTAADVATDVMAIFNKTAEEMSSVVDGITGVTTNSKFTIDDYALAIAQAGAVTSATGISLEEFNAVITATSSAFSSGSDAGTSFRTLLQRLSNPTDEAKELMQELGLSLFDTEGNMRDMADIIEQLNTVFPTLTDAQQAQITAQLGGADASRTIIELSKLTREEFIALTAEVNRSGAASEAAATRVDSLRGAMDIFRGIVEAVQLQVGDLFLPILQRLTERFTELASNTGPVIIDFFERVANIITDVIDIGSQLIETFQTGGVAGIADFIGLTPETEELVSKIISSFLELGNAIRANLSPALSSLTAGNILDTINTAIEFLNENFEAFKGAIIGVGIALAGAAIAATIAGITTAVVALANPITAIIAAAALLGAAWSENWFGIQETTQSTIEALTPFFEGLKEGFEEFINVLLPILKANWQELVTVWQENVLPAFTQLGIAFSKLGDALGLSESDITAFDVAMALAKATIIVIIGIIEGLTEVIKLLATAWSEVGEVVATRIEQFSNLAESLRGLGDTSLGVGERLSNLGGTLKDLVIPDFLQPGSPTPLELGLIGIAGGVSDVLSELIAFGRIVQSAVNPLSDLEQILSTTFQKSVQLFNKIVNPIFITTRDTIRDILAAFITLSDDVLPAVASSLDEAGQSANVLANSLAVITGLSFDTLGNRIGDIGDKLSDEIKRKAGEARQKLSEMNNVDFNTLKGNLNDIISDLDDIISKAQQAVTELNNVGQAGGSGGGSPSSKFVPQSTLIQQSALLAPSMSPQVSVSIGPVTINSDMDMAIFEQRVERVIVEATTP